MPQNDLSFSFVIPGRDWRTLLCCRRSFSRCAREEKGKEVERNPEHCHQHWPWRQNRRPARPGNFPDSHAHAYLLPRRTHPNEASRASRRGSRQPHSVSAGYRRGKKKAAQSGSASATLLQNLGGATSALGSAGNGRPRPGRAAREEPPERRRGNRSSRAGLPSSTVARTSLGQLLRRALLPCIIRPSSRTTEQGIGDLSSRALSDWLLGNWNGPSPAPRPFCCFCPLAYSCFLRSAPHRRVPLYLPTARQRCGRGAARRPAQPGKYVQEKGIAKSRRQEPRSSLKMNQICGRA